MTDIQVRGGTFPPGTECEFRNDQFHFDVDAAASGNAKLYIGDAVEVRVIKETPEGTGTAGAGVILCAAGAGAIIGACVGAFTSIFSSVFGALLCGWLANGTDITIPGQTTFEMRFSDNRTLVGTVETSEWAGIQDACRLLASATPSMLRSAKVPPASGEPSPSFG